jgi:hypothetical protein
VIILESGQIEITAGFLPDIERARVVFVFFPEPGLEDVVELTSSPP